MCPARAGAKSPGAQAQSLPARAGAMTAQAQSLPARAGGSCRAGTAGTPGHLAVAASFAAGTAGRLTHKREAGAARAKVVPDSRPGRDLSLIHI